MTARWTEEQYKEHLRLRQERMAAARPPVTRAARKGRQTKWTPELIETLQTTGSGFTAGQLSDRLGISVSSIRNAAIRFGVTLQVMQGCPRWTAEEVRLLHEEYAKPVTDVNGLATRLGREAGNLSRKAKEFGLTDPCRIKKLPDDRRPPRRKFGTKEELSAAQSANAKRRIAEGGHPRGFLGKRHTAEVKAAQSELSRALWADPASGMNAPHAAQRRSDLMLSRIAAGEMRSGYTRCAGGKRADLGDQYFRSSWEANYARYLNWLQARGQIVSWEYEPRTFIYETIQRGNRAYTPDFLVHFYDMHQWHEVKGWMDASSRVRIERFRKFFPEERLLVIGADWFKKAGRLGLPKMIHGWEFGGKRAKPSAPPV